jgi:hypothetical protein
MKSPTSPQVLEVAEAVDTADVELWVAFVTDWVLDMGTPVAYDDAMVVELVNCDGVDE